MKRVILTISLVLISIVSFARSISNVERNGSWYYLYDENGRKYKTESVSARGDLKGFSASIVVFQNGVWIYVFDAEMKKLYTGSVSACGEVIAVAGDTFTTRHGSWIYTFNKSGKKISTRSAR